MAEAKNRLFMAAELLDLAEHLICVLETSDRDVVVKFGVTELRTIEKAGVFLNARSLSSKTRLPRDRDHPD